jgi:hypothetical protein
LTQSTSSFYLLANSDRPCYAAFSLIPIADLHFWEIAMIRGILMSMCCLVAVCHAVHADATDSVMGIWDGDWRNDDGHGGKLAAHVIAEGNDNYKAVFTAYYGPVAVFRVSLKGKREKDAVKFGGKVDLGAAFGGEFDWTGGVADEKFTGRYTSAKDVGEFTLRKVRKTPATVGAKPPPGATILFDGTKLDAWQTRDGGPAVWRIVDGAMEVTKGDIYTRATFGDVQLHIEFNTPFMPEAREQARGNSGVFLDRTRESTARDWEVQVLDSFGLELKENDCGAVYGLKAPNGNACLPPGEWQAFDISFVAPRYDETGKISQKARITVVHNGSNVIKDLELEDAGPRSGYIMLQDHGNPVRYRNIWLVQGDSGEK